jgi:hypothetical protein
MLTLVLAEGGVSIPMARGALPEKCRQRETTEVVKTGG